MAKGTEGSFFALFCLEEVDTSTIEQLLNQAAEQADQRLYWLADKYSDLPEDEGDEGTDVPIGANWRSPLIGKTIEQAADFVKNAPTDKGLDREFFAVLESKQFQEKHWVTVCRIGRDGSVTHMPTEAKTSTEYLYGNHGESWEIDLEDWRTKGKPAMREGD